jgi:fumarate reductase flavoprotein subunit
MLWVNIDGKRFMDEAISGANAGRALNRQPGQVCYALVDSEAVRYIKETPREGPRPTTEQEFNTLYEDLDRETAEGKKAWKANTLDELANLLRVNPEVLKETVERYNYFCDNGYDKEFIKDPKYLRPVRTPPFYAILGIQGYSYTLGGIKINERMEALNKAGNTIRGLYATGLNASEWVTANYPQHGGTSLTWAYCSGYIAGENAAKYVLGEMSQWDARPTPC